MSESKFTLRYEIVGGREHVDAWASDLSLDATDLSEVAYSIAGEYMQNKVSVEVVNMDEFLAWARGVVLSAQDEED